MSSNTYTVKTIVQSAQPRSKRLRGLAGDVVVGSGSAGSVAGSVGEGHSHANKSLLDSLLSDEEGYLYIVGKMEDSDDSIAAKILAGSADKWAGHAWDEYMDQPLRSTDDVVFASTTVEKVVFTNGAVLEVDGDRIKINKVLYSTKNLAVLGEGEDVPDGGSGASYNRLDTWDGYDNNTMAGYVLSAALGYDINTRLTTLENSGLTGDYLPSTTKYALSDKVGGDAMALYDYSRATEVSDTIPFIGGLTYSNQELTYEGEGSYSQYIPVFYDDSEPTIQPMRKTDFLKMLGFKVMSDGKPALSKKCRLWGNDFDGTADVDGRLSIEPETDGSVISIGNGYGDEGGGIFTYSYGGDEGKRVIFLYAGTSQDQDALTQTQGIALYNNGKIRLNAAPGFAVFNNSPTEDIEMWGTFGGYLEKIKFKNGATIEVDGDYLKVTSVLYSTKNVAVVGEGEDVPGGGGGASYNRLDTWDGYDNSTMAGYVLSAALGYDINTRLTTLENNSSSLGLWKLNDRNVTTSYTDILFEYSSKTKCAGGIFSTLLANDEQSLTYIYAGNTYNETDTGWYIYSSGKAAFITDYNSGWGEPDETVDINGSLGNVTKIVFDGGDYLELSGGALKVNGEKVGSDITDTLLTLWNNYSLAIQDKWALSAGLGYQLYQKAHTHDNKGVLDTITSTMVNKWNGNYLPTTTKYALSDAVGGNALYANKLTYSRKISLSGAVQSNGEYFNGSSDLSIPVNYIYDDYIQSNGIAMNNNLLNSLTKLWIDQFRANQIAFIDPDAITVQYSRDGGSTWTNYRPRTTADEIYLDNLFKKRFVSGINTNLSDFYVLGKENVKSTASNNNQLRIEIDTYKAKLDCNIEFIIPYIGDMANSLYLTIDKRHTTTGVWTTLVNKVQIKGAPGYNKVNIPNGGIRTDLYNQGNGTTDSWHTRFIRFTFTQEMYTTVYGDSYVYNLFALGSTYTSPTVQGKTGLLYDYDENQNMKLPAGLYTNFINFGNGCYIIADGDKLKVHGTIYSDSNVAVKTE